MKIGIFWLFLLIFSDVVSQQVKQKCAYKGITNPELNLGRCLKNDLGFDVCLETPELEIEFKQLILSCIPNNLKEIIEKYKDKKNSANTPKLILVNGPSGSGKTVTSTAIAQELGLSYIRLTAANVFRDAYVDTPQRVLMYAQDLAKKNHAMIILEDVEVFNELGHHFLNFLKYCHDENILIIANTTAIGPTRWLENYAETISFEPTAPKEIKNEILASSIRPCACNEDLLKKWAQKLGSLKKYQMEAFGIEVCRSASLARNSRAIVEEDFQEAYKIMIRSGL